MIHVWRILNGLSPKFDDDRFKIFANYNGRKGLDYRIPALCQSSQGLKTLTDESFAVAGPKHLICNSQEVRDHNESLDSFKAKPDNFLWIIPDQAVIMRQPQAITCNRLDVRV